MQDILSKLAQTSGLTVTGGKIRRTSSRFCFGVEHGDYNGTELFGVGTDRFIWMAYKPNATGRIRLFSDNFPADGIIDFRPGETPPPRSVSDSWARFPLGVAHILRRAGFPITRGFDAVLHANIPGGGMSRSASLILNLMLTLLEANGLQAKTDMQLIDLSQAVENDYIGSPSGQLDQIMIYFAKAGMGTHYNPATRAITYVPLGKGALDFRIVSLDTGTVRPGLEKSTYKIRRAECDELARLAGLKCLAEVRDEATYRQIAERFPKLAPRLNYIYHAQQRFYRLLDAWKSGDIETVGSIFRQDGFGLRDDYQISGPELETMCDIARTVPGVLGERMLGGGDKGASGAIVRAESVAALKQAVDTEYPRRQPAYAQKYAVHVCNLVDGIAVMPGI
ncbi:MAG: Galactokinase [Verrucomicrobiae bacterium]|nr:Galactokinase [Verrucomicrobiae bacterium]